MKREENDLFNFKFSLPDWVQWKRVPAKNRGMLLALIVLMFLGMFFMFIGNRKTTSSQPAVPPSQPAAAGILPAEEAGSWSESRLESQLTSILSKIQGVTRVQVNITFAESAQDEWLRREKREERIIKQDSGGETREWRVEREPVFRREKDGLEEPVRIKTYAPKIAGVLVVADGAENTTVKRRLWEATATVLGVPMHRVIVMPWGE